MKKRSGASERFDFVDKMIHKAFPLRGRCPEGADEVKE